MVEPSVSIEQGGRALCRAGEWGAADVREDVAKLYAPVSGRGWVSVEGRRTTLVPGALFLLPSRSTLCFGTSGRILIDWVHFRLEPAWLDGRLSQLGRPVVFRGRAADRWRALCRRLGPFFQRPTASLSCRIHAMLLEVSAAALQLAPQPPSASSSAWQRLAPALAHLDRHALDPSPPSLQDLADSLHLSAEHFHRLFRAALGITPLRHLLRIRMRRAQQMLADPGRSIGEIATACGYADAFYFSRVFRKYFGRSPRLYRAAIAGRP